MSMDETLTTGVSGSAPASVDQRPTVKSLNDRVTAIEHMLNSIVGHMEGSLNYKIARLPDTATEQE